MNRLPTLHRYLTFGFVNLIFLALLQSYPGVSHAQHELQQLLETPPELLADPDTIAAQIQWQIRQKEALRLRYREGMADIRNELRFYDNKISESRQSQPASLGVLDQEARSALAAKVLEKMLTIQLELVAHEQEMKLRTSENPSEVETLERKLLLKDFDSQVQVARLEMQTANDKLQQSLKMKEKQFISDVQLERDKVALEIAETKFQNMQAKLELLMRQPEADNAEQLSQQKVKVEPLKAQLSLAKALLDDIATAARLSEQEQSLLRERALADRQTERLHRDVVDLEVEIYRLRTLDKLLSEARKDKKGK